MYGEYNAANKWYRKLCWVKTVDETFMKGGAIGMSVYARSKTSACGYQ